MKLESFRPSLKSYSSLAMTLKPNTIYEHYSGKKYKLINIARCSETLEELVIYQELYDEMNFWIRPLVMFCENVEISGCLVPRFRSLENINV